MKLPQCSRLVLRTRVPAKSFIPWKGKHPLKEHYDLMLSGNCEVRGPKGEFVCQVLRGVLSEEAVSKAVPVLHWMRKFKSDNRGTYAGAAVSGKQIKADGTKSRSIRALDKEGNRITVSSTVAGYYERQGGRHPFCRATGIVRNHPEEWSQLIPLMQECSKVFEAAQNAKYLVQMKYVASTDPAWVIPGTPFTTVTVNNTVPAAYHQDGGDLKEGLGILLGFKKGNFDGFELVIPEYRVALELSDRDVLLFNPTVWHGNIPPSYSEGELDEDWYRMSMVLYYREGILGCGSPEEELKRSKDRGAL